MVRTPKLTPYKRLKIERASPEELEQIASREIWWSPEILKLVLERVDAIVFENPREGNKAADAALRLAEAVLGLHPDADLWVATLATAGSARRSVGQYMDAGRIYKEALSTQGIDQLSRANVLRRRAVLYLVRGRTDEAKADLRVASSVYRNYPSDLAICRSIESVVLAYCDADIHGALSMAISALPLVNATHDPRLYLSLIRNIVGWLARLPEVPPSELITSLKVAEANLRRTPAGWRLDGYHQSKRSVPLAMWRWATALLDWRLGESSSTREKFRIAIQSLRDVGADQDALICVVDACIFELSQGQPDQVGPHLELARTLAWGERHMAAIALLASRGSTYDRDSLLFARAVIAGSQQPLLPAARNPRGDFRL